MKRRVVFVLLLVIGIPIALLALGGLSYQREVEYVEVVPANVANEVSNPEVSIHSTRLTRVGSTDFLAFFVDGPPFELQIVGTAPDQRAATSCQLVSLSVRTDDATLLSVSNKDLPLNVKVQHGQQPSVKGCFFSAPSFLSGTPQRLHVQGTLSFPSSAGADTVTFKRAFELHASKRIVVGSSAWYL
jgi:hypothetical protein